MSYNDPWDWAAQQPQSAPAPLSGAIPAAQASMPVVQQGQAGPVTEVSNMVTNKMIGKGMDKTEKFVEPYITEGIDAAKGALFQAAPAVVKTPSIVAPAMSSEGLPAIIGANPLSATSVMPLSEAAATMTTPAASTLAAGTGAAATETGLASMAGPLGWAYLGLRATGLDKALGLPRLF